MVGLLRKRATIFYKNIDIKLKKYLEKSHFLNKVSGNVCVKFEVLILKWEGFSCAGVIKVLFF